MDLKNVFGIDVERRFLDWFHGPYAAEFKERFPGKGITLILIDPDRLFSACLHWDEPTKHQLLSAFIGDEEASTKPGGTYDNVVGKLQFVLRNMEDSLEAEEHPECVRPGDFPWQGAGEDEGWTGGVSGLDKADDWAVFLECIGKLRELVGAVTKIAMAKADELRHTEGAPTENKYLRGITVTDAELDEALATTA